MTTHKPPSIDIDDPAIQEACAAILRELLRSGWQEDRQRHPDKVPVTLDELGLTLTWRRVLVAAAHWTTTRIGSPSQQLRMARLSYHARNDGCHP